MLTLVKRCDIYIYIYMYSVYSTCDKTKYVIVLSFDPVLKEGVLYTVFTEQDIMDKCFSTPID